MFELSRVWKFATRLLRDRGGNVAIMTALALPTLMVMILGSTTVMKALSERRQLQAIAQTACNRAVKPQRLISLTDAQRSLHAQQLFDTLVSDRKITIKERTVTSNWLQAEVSASATVEAMPGWGEQAAIPISVSERCTGIPPYPAKGDVILSSNFKTPSGTAVDLRRTNVGKEKYDVFTAVQAGWDGQTGPGIEIQDWVAGFTLAGLGKQLLPPGISSTYVVELDSAAMPGFSTPTATCGIKGPSTNSSMFKTFELHPGTYRLSLWFRSRVTRASVEAAQGGTAPSTDTTNRVVVYLEGTQPVSPKAAVIVYDDYSMTWQQRSHEIAVSNYGLYKLHVVAEGCSDGSGGLFNDLKIEDRIHQAAIP